MTLDTQRAYSSGNIWFQTELAVNLVSSFWRTLLVVGQVGEAQGHPKDLLKFSCSAFLRTATVPYLLL